jgi:hypothetical protein
VEGSNRRIFNIDHHAGMVSSSRSNSRSMPVQRNGATELHAHPAVDASNHAACSC